MQQVDNELAEHFFCSMYIHIIWSFCGFVYIYERVRINVVLFSSSIKLAMNLDESQCEQET